MNKFQLCSRGTYIIPGGKRPTKRINHHIKTRPLGLNTVKGVGLEKERERERMCAISDKVVKEVQETILNGTLNKVKNETMQVLVKSVTARRRVQRPRRRKLVAG